MNSQFRKYLRFLWNGNCYEYTCLPNGLSSAPRVFTKMLKPVFSSLRKLGHSNTVYLDDSLLQSDTQSDCELNIKDTVKLVDDLGFTVHTKKSVVIPTQCIVFVGFVLNSVDMTIRLTDEKALNIVQECKNILSKKSITIREFAQIIGKLVATEPGVQYAPLYYKRLELHKDKQLQLSRGQLMYLWC